jgi:hypothetical protein
MIYFIVFTISIFITYLAEYSIRRKSRFSFYLFSIIAIVIPSTLAGVRDTGIGTDTTVYVDIVFDRIIRVNSLEELYYVYSSKSLTGVHIEFIYLLLNYLVSLFGDNVNWVYFFANLITCTFFYMAAYDNRKKASMWLVMTFFFFLFYNQSYNLVRQSLALSMTIYAFKYIEAKKWIKIVIWSIIILNTHATGLGFILLFAIHYICNLKSKGIRVFLTTIFFVGMISIYFLFSELLLFLISMGVIQDKFLAYFPLKGDSAISASIIIMYLLFVVLLLVVKLWIIKNDKNLWYYIYNKIIGILLFNLSVISTYLFRFSLYINVMDCIIIPRTLHLLSPKKNKTVILHVLTILLLISVWLWQIIINNDNETYPYTSEILGIE